MTLDLVIFMISAVVAVFGATMMILQRNPVASVLYMIVSLVAQAVLYVQLGALFLGAVLIIVYSGAILVLFLFVIMLLNLRGKEDFGAPRDRVSRGTKAVLSILFVAELAMVVRSGLATSPFARSTKVGVMSLTDDGFGSVTDVATTLFQRYLYPFELTSILLLAAIVGAVVMARRDRPDDHLEGEPTLEYTEPDKDEVAG